MRDEFRVTIIHNGETLRVRCGTETEARYLVSLLAEPSKRLPTEIGVDRVRGVRVKENVLHLAEGELT